LTNGLFRFWVFPDCTFLDISTRIDDATVDKMPHVEFEGLEVHLYYIDKRPIITVTADNVHVAKF